MVFHKYTVYKTIKIKQEGSERLIFCLGKKT